MERMELKVTSREIGKKTAKKLRQQGEVPAILYGVGCEPKPLYVNRREADHALGTSAGWNVLLDLMVDGKEKILTRVSDYQINVMDRKLTHLDFQLLDLNKKIKVSVPVKLVGAAIGVKEGGIMEQITRSLDIRCLPTNIPEHIEVEVSHLNVGDNIHLSDITLPADVEPTYDTNISIAAVVAPTKEIEAVPAAVEAVPAEGEAAAAPAEGEAAAAPAEGEAAPKKESAPAEGKKKE